MVRYETNAVPKTFIRNAPTVGQLSGTFGAALVSAMLLGPTPPRLYQDAERRPALAGSHIARPLGQSFQSTQVWSSSIDPGLYVALKAIYEQVAAKQHELEPDFKRVLYSNLWDLYE